MVDFKQKLEEEEKIKNNSNEFSAEKGVILNGKRKRFTVYTATLIVVILIFAGKVLISSQSTSDWLGNGFFNRLTHFSEDRKLRGEENDRINILLLGMGGEGHDGAFLTDTIILASIRPSTKQVSLVSFPRDLVSPVSGWQKINSINAYAEQKEPNSGGVATKESFSSLLQMPIDYYIRVDFNGFKNIIDELGGIEVNVENTLEDYSYPIMGQENNPNYYARFEHLRIEAGLQTLDGSTALKYARSRHGLGKEGSDFARARRQQLVIEAVKNKLLSAKTLLNPVMLSRLSEQLSQNISTDISTWEALRLWDITKDINRSNIINLVLSDAPDNLLVAGTGDNGAYILTPKSGNFSAIRSAVQNIFLLNPPAGTEADNKIEDESIIVILNGTWSAGLAGKTAEVLKASGFQVAQIGNAAARDYSSTIVFDLSQGKKKDTLDVLRRVVPSVVSENNPEWLDEYKKTGNSPDFIIIIGNDYVK